jgi:hypothetical protein
MLASSSSTGERSRIRVVVTCTDRKRGDIPPGLRVRELAPGSIEDRCRAWTERVVGSEAPCVPASDLYCGDHWYVARSLLTVPARGGVELWIASAGYGLISGKAGVRGYAATFAPRHEDSVVHETPRGRSGGAERWWEALSHWPGPIPGSPRSLAQLAASEPDAPILVVASAVYTDALASDILAARSLLRDPEQIALVSAGTAESSPVRELVIPVDARLQATLGGARQSLNVRLARHLLAAVDGDLRLPSLVAAAQRLMDDAPPLPKYNRLQRSDAEVTHFIAAERRRSPGISCARLLRGFRDQGFACEQQRFHILCQAVARGER